MCLDFTPEYCICWCAIMVFKTHSTITGMYDYTPMAYQTFTHQIWWVMVCYNLVHQIRCAKHTFSGRCDITLMVCCSFGVHSTPQFLHCGFTTIIEC